MQVTIRQFVKDFRQIVGQNVGQKSLQLGKGQCPDHEAYKQIVGWISGMEAAAELADNMLRQMEEADEGDGKLGEMPQMNPPMMPQ